ncbi:MAG TPA: outer membrane lipid asymmetry maintenance protein MlaD [Myxococcota bacterium]|jgi:phospholipid/cholesterol/gamma-HCH transport system substrate-binding protein
MSKSTRDFIVGLFVLAGLGALAYLSLKVGGIERNGRGGLELSAEFSEIGGLKEQSPVVVSGVRIGRVKRIELTPDLRAVVVLDVDAKYHLPTDSSAAIRTEGLLGQQFVALEPGAEDSLLKSGDKIAFTESALSIERLVGDFVHGNDLEKSEE